VLLLSAAYGARLALGSARHSEPTRARSSEDSRITELERRTRDTRDGLSGTIEDSQRTAGTIAARERDSLEGYRGLTTTARTLTDEISTIGGTTDRTRECLEELRGIVEELQKRAGEEQQHRTD